MLLRSQSHLAESRIALERAIALDRNYAPALMQLGYTLIALGQPEAALPDFEKALRLSPRDQNIVYRYSGMGYCHLLLGHADEAAEFLRKAYAENTRIWYIPLLLAGALGLRGDIEEAKAALSAFQKLRPEITSLARLKADSPSTPQFAALAEKTLDVGLRRAGLPEE
jgi:tetratricopeptide (TPR) repeat protein